MRAARGVSLLRRVPHARNPEHAFCPARFRFSLSRIPLFSFTPRIKPLFLKRKKLTVIFSEELIQWQSLPIQKIVKKG
jgi:hypothetical protein